MFDADRPIIKAAQDRLNRAVFSKYLARCMLNHNDINSTVLGLYGGWGNGKTSVINLVLEELNFAATNIEDSEKPIVLNFSPWSYSGQDQIIYSFFRRLSAALRKDPYLKRSTLIIHLLELYVSFFTNKPVPKPLRQRRSLFEFLTLHSKEDVYGWESGRDLTEVKAELNRLLAAETHKIIIVIDNISRLRDDEIQQIFQIVKSIGDFSNTIYLLAFDKDQVVYALNRLHGRGGEAFVEKVIQLPFDIPTIDAQSLEPILIDRLDEMIKMVPTDTWQKDYWADIYYSSFRYFFKNVRDITRYINTLHFSYMRLRDVVHPVDFFALTAISVFLPEVYANIRDSKDLFTGLIDHVYLENKDFFDKDKVRCENILIKNERISKSGLHELLTLLFPRLKKIYGDSIQLTETDDVATDSKRVCNPDIFDVYFRLSIQEGQVPEIEFKSTINLAAKSESFDQALARLNKDERIMPFLCQLDGHVLDDVPETYVENIVSSFFDNADLFPKGVNSPLSFDTFSRLHRIIRRLLAKLPQEKRYFILANAINKMKNSILFGVFEIKELLKEYASIDEHRLLSHDHLTNLKKLICIKISEWAQSGRLQEHPERLSLMYAWSEWGDGHQCEQYVTILVKSDPGLVSFLQAALQKPILDAMTEYKKNADWEKSLVNITHFITIDLIKDRAKAIFEDNYFEKLRETEQLSIVIFLDLIQADTTKYIAKTSV